MLIILSLALYSKSSIFIMIIFYLYHDYLSRNQYNLMNRSENLKILLLTREYQLLNRRFLFYVADYKAQFRYLSIYLTIFAGIIIYLLSTHEPKLPLPPTTWLYDVALSFSLGIAYTVSANLFDTLFEIFIIEARLAAIEQLINAEMKEDIYVWQHRIINPWHDLKNVRINTFLINPPHQWGFWNFFFLIGLTVIHCILYMYLSKHHWLFFCVPAMLCSSFILWQWVELTRSVPFLRKKIFAESGLEYMTQRKTVDPITPKDQPKV